MKVPANSIEELIAMAGKHELAMIRMHEFILATAPTFKPSLLKYGSMSLIAYGPNAWYGDTPSGDPWPAFSMAPQKTAVSLYTGAAVEGVPLLDTYAPRLGKANCGKYCLRFTKFENLNEQALREFIEESVKLTNAALNKAKK